MNQNRSFAPLLPAFVGLVLLVWGLWVMYTAFKYGTLPVVGWATEYNRLFGLTWFITFFIVLLPAYAYAISLGLHELQGHADDSARPQRGQWLVAVGVAVLLCALTFCARVAVSAWFPSPMHPPLRDFQGGRVAGLAATMILVLLEAGVLAGIKHQARRQQSPFPLLLPGFFALVLLAWAVWVAFTAFTDGALPIVGWRTEHRRLFGWLWVGACLVALLPAYLYAIGLGILGLIERSGRNSPTSQNFWLVAISITALLALVTLATRLAVTAWFPVPMHAPLSQFEGGTLMGVLATAACGGVVLLFYKVARSF